MEQVIYTAYAPEADITFIMMDTYDGDDLKTTECVGWYHGAPDERATAEFCGKLKAEY